MTPATAAAAEGVWRYPYEAQPKQARAHRLWANERLFGGAAGGGKSEWLLAECLWPVFRFGAAALILRRTFPQLNQPNGLIQRLRARIPRHVGRYDSQQHLWTFVNGGQLQLGFIATDRDVERYMGAEYAVVGFDQVEQFTEWQYQRMSHPMRVTEDSPAGLAGFVPYKVATANPGGVGHQWVKDRWIDPAPDSIVWQPSPTMDEPEPGTRCFVQSLLSDNKYLGAAYRRLLEGLPEDDRKALLEGDWDAYGGSRFGRLWKRQIHIVDPEQVPLPPVGTAPRALGIDYGMDSPFCALWGAKLADGLIVVYRELYQHGLTAPQQALAVKQAEGPGERGPGINLPAALDPSTWARDPGQPTVDDASKAMGLPPRGSIAWHYSVGGVQVLRANNDRLSGVGAIADKLRVREDGRPRLYVYRTCRNLIRTLPSVPRDKLHPELYDDDSEDHAVDALRYLIMLLDGRQAETRTARARNRAVPDKGSTVTGNLRRRGM